MMPWAASGSDQAILALWWRSAATLPMHLVNSYARGDWWTWHMIVIKSWVSDPSKFMITVWTDVPGQSWSNFRNECFVDIFDCQNTIALNWILDIAWMLAYDNGSQYSMHSQLANLWPHCEREPFFAIIVHPVSLQTQSAFAFISSECVHIFHIHANVDANTRGQTHAYIVIKHTLLCCLCITYTAILCKKDLGLQNCCDARMRTQSGNAQKLRRTQAQARRLVTA